MSDNKCRFILATDFKSRLRARLGHANGPRVERRRCRHASDLETVKAWPVALSPLDGDKDDTEQCDPNTSDLRDPQQNQLDVKLRN